MSDENIKRVVHILESIRGHASAGGNTAIKMDCDTAIALLTPQPVSREHRIAKCCDKAATAIRNGDWDAAANHVERIGLILMNKEPQ